MTTYDDIYGKFIPITKTDNFNLPQTNEGKYDLIKSAIDRLNNRLGLSIVSNDSTESVNIDMNPNQLLITAHYMRLIFLENDLTSYATIWQPFAKDIGLVNYRDTISAKKYLVTMQLKTIEDLIMYSEDDFL